MDSATINATIHNDATNDATETDTLKLFSNLSPEDIWFQKQGADLIVTIGGASVGEHDLVGRVAGLEHAFWKIALRPGKPLMAGRYRGVPMLGLPGGMGSRATPTAPNRPAQAPPRVIDNPTQDESRSVRDRYQDAMSIPSRDLATMGVSALRRSLGLE